MALCFVTVLMCLFVPVKSYSTGILPPAEEACASMFPLGHGAQPQQTSSPFVIRVSDRSYYGKKSITVTLDSRCNHMFKGFLIQARRADPDHPQDEFIGTFSPIILTRNVCGPAGNSGLTHTNNQTKTSLDFIWNAPPGLNDHIVFRATFVEDFHTFWVNVTSPIVTGNLHITVPFQTTWMTRTMYPCSTKDARFVIDPRCGYSMGCLHDCDYLSGCTMQVSWRDRSEGPHDQTVEFTIKTILLGNGDKWAAIGFSEDTKMGWDSVSECVEVGTGIFVYPSINLDHTNIRMSQHPVGLVPIAGSDRDGIFQCTFRRNKTSDTGDPRYFNLEHDFYILVASGRATPEGNKIKHTTRPKMSIVTIDLQQQLSIHVNTMPKGPPRPISHSQFPHQQRTLHSHPTLSKSPHPLHPHAPRSHTLDPHALHPHAPHSHTLDPHTLHSHTLHSLAHHPHTLDPHAQSTRTLQSHPPHVPTHRQPHFNRIH